MIKAYVVSHTHWDREWFRPFQLYRFRLADTLDELINYLEKHPEFRAFHFDGQTVFLEDYLEVRPEMEHRLKNLINAGRLLVGPWYTMPDEFLVSGEAMIRNLLRGFNISQGFGKAMKIGYVSDIFGHHAQFPQIVKGFGIDYAFLMRGIREENAASEFMWQGLDGTQVITYRCPGEGSYANMWFALWKLPQDDSFGRFWRTRWTVPEMKKEEYYNEVTARLEKIAEREKASAAVPFVLFMDGGDNTGIRRELMDIIRQINRRSSKINLEQATLSEFFQRVEKFGREKLPVIKGELRFRNRNTLCGNLHQNCLSARMHLKTANKSLELLLERYAEPLAVMASFHGEKYPSSFLDLAWKYLLLNHAHDDICGCSCDDVHDDMEYRNRQCRQIAEEVIERELAFLHGKNRHPVFQNTLEVVTVFNPIIFAGNSVWPMSFDVEPGQGFEIINDQGRPVPFQVLSQKTVNERLFWTGGAFPNTPPREKFSILVDGSAPEPFGITSFGIRPCEKIPTLKGSLSPHPNILENEFLKVTIHKNGTFDLLNKENKTRFNGLGYFEDCGDVGDAWCHRKPAKDLILTTLKTRPRIEKAFDGPLAAAIRISYEWKLPEKTHPDTARAKEPLKKIVLSSELKLVKGKRVLEIETTIDNTIRDHRLQTVFPTGLVCRQAKAAMPFGFAERTLHPKGQTDAGWVEPDNHTAPNQGWVGLSDGKKGLIVLNHGIPEYEVKGDRTRALALTLLRSFRYVELPPDREGGQSLHPLTLQYALRPIKGPIDPLPATGELEHFLLAPKTYQSPPVAGENIFLNSPVLSWPKTLIFSALKQSEDGRGIIMRFYNPTLKTVKDRITFRRPFKNIRQTNLKEDLGKKSPLKYSRTLEIKSGPAEILTFYLS